MASYDTINQLCDIVRQTAYDIHCYHRHGYPEKVYENALAHRLAKLGIAACQQHSLKVFDEDGTEIGDYNADLFVEDKLVIELKAVKTIASEHIAQLLGYLKSSRIETGLLINFGSYQFQIRKYLFNTSDTQPQSSNFSGNGEVPSNTSERPQ